jgi:hypothetical protein
MYVSQHIERAKLEAFTECKRNHKSIGIITYRMQCETEVNRLLLVTARAYYK